MLLKVSQTCLDVQNNSSEMLPLGALTKLNLNLEYVST